MPARVVLVAEVVVDDDEVLLALVLPVEVAVVDPLLYE